MKESIDINLFGLRFFAFHGLYPEEQKLGNEFEVNVSVTRIINTGIVTDITDTLNYVELYQLINREMLIPRKLLETLAMEIAMQIHQQFEKIKKVEFEITKLHLPVERFTGQASVKYSKEF
jgi:7,8-dihydroneopterin aldolase/epimerase/oxygenase